ncbi:LysR family transcriptional regulator [Gorillibacterium massiliense]|uniref:LysR family transcriptional regulator n=1 Tax=Gorillibacterium massiliense TaxID=1280390 RepID=UPI0004BB4272|nr:LysR family transcriptional regulator [Gorillibacterium massiliense]
MDVRQLHYFTEVARCGSFTKASETLHLSQSTLSKGIKSLEEELGVSLFDRSSRRIELTDAGETVLSEAESILQSFYHLTDTLYEVMQVKKGTVRLGMPPIIGSLFFPGIIARFHKQYPGISIRLGEDGSKRVEQAVQNGETDAGVVVLPVEEGLFDIRPFLQEKLAVIVGCQHPLAGSREVQLAALKDEPFILLKEGFAINDRIREECRRLGYVPHIVYESAEWDFISEMVAEGLGLSFLPESLCRKLDASRIRTLDLTGPVIPYEVAVITRIGRYLSFAARAFLDHVEQESIQPTSR